MINLNTKLLSNGAKHIKMRSIGSDGKTESKDSECVLFKTSENIEISPEPIGKSEILSTSNTVNLTSMPDPNCESYSTSNEKVRIKEKRKI